MTQLEFNKYGFWIMCFINVVLLIFVFLPRSSKPSGRPHEIRQRAKDMLQLDEKQKDAFKGLADGHHNAMDSISKLQKMILKPYFDRISDTTMTITTAEMLLDYEKLEGEKITISISHFRDVKALLRPNQYVHFDEFMGMITEQLFNRENKRPPLRKKS